MRVIEFLGVPNSGKTTCGESVSEKSNGQVIFWKNRFPVLPNSDNINHELMCLKSLEFFYASFIELEKSTSQNTVVIIDRGLNDKFIYYSVLFEMGIISIDVVNRCKELFNKLNWILYPKVIFTIPLNLIFEREVIKSKHEKRWAKIFNNQERTGLKMLCQSYLAIRLNERDIFVNGVKKLEDNTTSIFQHVSKIYE